LGLDLNTDTIAHEIDTYDISAEGTFAQRLLLLFAAFEWIEDIDD
jgi:hypothetical protein